MKTSNQIKNSFLVILIFIIGTVFNFQNESVFAQTLTYSAEINKSFTPISILPGQASRLKVTIYNPNTFPLALGNPGWTDTLPANVLFDPTNPNPTTDCAGGTVSVSGSTLSISGGTVPAKVGSTNGQCSVEINVTSTVSGNHINTIPSANLHATKSDDSTISVTNTTPASATITVGTVQPPSLSKNFNPNTIYAGNVSRLTIILRNNDTATTLTEVTYTDTLPTYLVLAATVNPVLTNCGTGTVTAVAGTSGITLNNGSIAPGVSCSVAVNVTSTEQGTYTNTIPAGPAGTGSVQTRQGVTNGSDAQANLNVQKIDVVKSFNPTTIVAGAVSTLTITLKNPLAAEYTGVGLTDNLPAGLQIANSPAASTTCGGTLTATAGTQAITLTDGTIPPMTEGNLGTCTISVPVTTPANAPDITYTNKIDKNTLITDQGVSNPNDVVANITIKRWLTGTKSFSPAYIAQGGTSTVTITLKNNRTDVALSEIAFTDTMPGGLTVSEAPSTSQCGGTIASTSSSVSLTDGTIAANSTCTITFKVTASNTGNYSNTIPVDNITTGEGAKNTEIKSNPNLGVIVPNTPIKIAKDFSPNPIAPGTNAKLHIQLTAPLDTAVSGISFTDSLPAGMRITNSTPASNGCGGTLTADTGASSISLSGGAIANAGGTCNINVYVTVDASGSYTNTIGVNAVTTTEGRKNDTAASATLNASSFSMRKQFYPSGVNPNGYSTLTISLENSSLEAITDVTLLDDLATMGGTSPSEGVYVVPLNDHENYLTTCGGVVVFPDGSDDTLGANERKIRLTGGTIPARVGEINGLCTITVAVQGKGPLTTRTNTINKTEATGKNSGITIQPRDNATATLSIGALSLRVVKGFDPLLVYGGTDSKLSVQLINPNSVPLTGVAFVDTMPAGMIVANPANPEVGTCGGTLTAIPGEGKFTFTGGILEPSSSCTLTLRITMTVTGNRTNPIPAQAVSTYNGVKNPDPTEATLTNLPGASISKGFGDEEIDEGPETYSLLTITIKNINDVSLTNLGMIDNLPGTLPAGLMIAAAPPSVNNCGGTLTAVPGTQKIELSGGTLATYSSCTIIVPVTGTTAGTYTNVIPDGNLTDEEDVTNTTPTEDTLKIKDALPEIEVTKTGDPVNIPEEGGPVTFTYTVTNKTAEAVEITALTDDKFTITGDDDCKVGTILAGRSSCSFEHTFTIPAGTYPGNHVNVFMATAEDNEGNTDSAQDNETVNRLPNGSIVIDKKTVPSGDQTSFEFTTTGEGYDAFELADESLPNSQSLTPNTTYSVMETVPDGWDLTSVVCESSIGDTETAAAIELDPGEVVTCTFTDTKRGIIQIDKNTIPSDSQDVFDFDASWSDELIRLSNASEIGESGWLLPGTYQISENVPNGWDLTSANCESSIGDTETPNAIELDPGEVVTCTFTDTKRASLTLKKEVVNDNGGTMEAVDFQASITADGAEDPENVAWDEEQLLVPGIYTLRESELKGYASEGWQCENTNIPQEPTVYGLRSLNNEITLAPGDEAVCTITNDDISPSLVLNKIVENPFRGIEAEAFWELKADGGEAGVLSGPGATGEEDVVSDETFQAGTYHLSEKRLRYINSVPGTWSCVKNDGDAVEGDVVQIEVGDRVICSITNTLMVKIPMTGFSAKRLTAVREQPSAMKYGTLGIQIEVPILDVTTEVVEVPEEEGSWAVEWLGSRAGLLSGSALPGEGTSYVAAHNHLNNMEIGPFLFIKDLAQNDRIFVRNNNGKLLEFSVYDNELFGPDDFYLVQQKAEEFENTLVLITCENEAEEGGYIDRRIVFAKRVSE